MGMRMTTLAVLTALTSLPLDLRAQDPADRGQQGTRTYRHPLGLTFEHPAGWRVQETATGLLLVPPRAEREMVVISGMPNGGRQVRADDAQVHRYLDAIVRRSPLGLRSSGAPRLLERGRLACFEWRGRDRAGQPIACRVYGQPSGGHYLSVMALGLTARLDARAEALLAIARSARMLAPQVDKRLVGLWYETTYHSSGGVTGRVNLASTRTIVIAPDGTIHAGNKLAISGQVRGTSLTALAKRLPDHGRWSAKGSVLYVQWPSVAVGWTFHLQGRPGRRELLLRSAHGKKRLLTEYR